MYLRANRPRAHINLSKAFGENISFQWGVQNLTNRDDLHTALILVKSNGEDHHLTDILPIGPAEEITFDEFELITTFANLFVPGLNNLAVKIHQIENFPANPIITIVAEHPFTVNVTGTPQAWNWRS